MPSQASPADAPTLIHALAARRNLLSGDPSLPAPPECPGDLPRQPAQPHQYKDAKSEHAPVSLRCGRLYACIDLCRIGVAGTPLNMNPQRRHVPPLLRRLHNHGSASVHAITSSPTGSRLPGRTTLRPVHADPPNLRAELPDTRPRSVFCEWASRRTGWRMCRTGSQKNGRGSDGRPEELGQADPAQASVRST